MNGAESLVETLVNNNIEVCFTNPGTSEMHFVAALDSLPGMRCVLGLFEGVVSGAADGYARMAHKPAATLLHLGPGLSNALANIHNAKKGNVPMLNIIGEHATYHQQYETPLTSDIEGIARSVSHWFHTSDSAKKIAEDGAKAAQAAFNNQIATLVLPADVSWNDNPQGSAPALPLTEQNKVSQTDIDIAASILKSNASTMILVGGPEITVAQGLLLGKLRQACSIRICVETFPTRIGRGAGSAEIEKLPYLAEMAIEHLRDLDNLILIGAPSPVSFFAYPNVPSVVTQERCNVFSLAQANDNLDNCLQNLVVAVGADTAEASCYSHLPTELPHGELNSLSMAQSIAHFLPEQAILVDEGATTTIPLWEVCNSAATHDWQALTGGAIGFGLPAAVGAAVACPDRKVICLEGDGSAMYTIQSLWTMARENLDITVIICNNQKYNILELEFVRTGANNEKPGPKAADMLDIGRPDMDFVEIANGMGIKASRASTAKEFNRQLQQAIAIKGPMLIDAIVPPLNFLASK